MSFQKPTTTQDGVAPTSRREDDANCEQAHLGFALYTTVTRKQFVNAGRKSGYWIDVSRTLLAVVILFMLFS